MTQIIGRRGLLRQGWEYETSEKICLVRVEHVNVDLLNVILYEKCGGVLRFASSVMQRHCRTTCTLLSQCPSICVRKKAFFSQIFPQEPLVSSVFRLYCIIQSSLHAETFVSFLSLPACRTICTLSVPYLRVEQLVLSPILRSMQNHLYSFLTLPACRTWWTLHYLSLHAKLFVLFLSFPA